MKGGRGSRSEAHALRRDGTGGSLSILDEVWKRGTFALT